MAYATSRDEPAAKRDRSSVLREYKHGTTAHARNGAVACRRRRHGVLRRFPLSVRWMFCGRKICAETPTEERGSLISVWRRIRLQQISFFCYFIFNQQTEADRHLCEQITYSFAFGFLRLSEPLSPVSQIDSLERICMSPTSLFLNYFLAAKDICGTKRPYTFAFSFPHLSEHLGLQSIKSVSSDEKSCTTTLQHASCAQDYGIRLGKYTKTFR